MENKVNIGVLRWLIDTEANYFVYEEIEHLHRLNPIYLCCELRRLRRKINNVCRLSYYRMPYRNHMLAFLSNESLESVEKLIRSKDIRFLFVEFLSDALANLRFLKRTKLPIIVNYRGFELSDRSIVEFLEPISDLAAKIITRSNFQKKELQKAGIDADKIAVVYTGINPEKIAFKPRHVVKNGLSLLSAGRFVEKKGFDTTLRFFKRFSKCYPSARLTLVGEGPLRKKVEEDIAGFGLLKRVVIKPFMDHEDFIKELFNHDIFILPSKTSKNGDREGIPNVLKEAMASGMPVVSTYHAGIPELIADGKTGFLVPEDDDAALFEKVEYILNNADMAKASCVRARAVIERKFNVIKTARMIENLMTKLL